MAGKGDIEAGKAYVALYVKNSDLVKGLKAAGQQLKSFGMSIAKIGAMFTAAGAAITGPILAAVHKFAEGGDKLDKMSGRTGVAVNALAELGFAAEQSGQDIDVVEASLKKMQKTIGGAITGGSADAFKQLGLSIADLQGLSPDQQFELIADRISKIQDPTLRAAAAMEIFGKNGTALLPMMEDGAAGIQKLRKEAQELGIKPTRESTKMAAAIVDAMNRVNRVVKSTWSAIGSAIAPETLRFLTTTKNVLISFQRWIKANKDLFTTAYKVGVALTIIGTVIGGLGTTFILAGAALTGLATMLTTVGAIVGAMLSPVGLLVIGVGAAIAAFFKFTQTGQALSVWLGERFGVLLASVREVIGGISDAFTAGDLTLAANIAWAGVQLAFYTAKDSIMAGFNDLKAAGNIAWASIKVAFVQVTNFISSVWDTFATGITSVFDGIVVSIRQSWNSVISWIASQVLKLWGVIEPVLNSLGLISEQTDIGGAIKVVEKDNQDYAKKLDSEKAKRDEQRGGEMNRREAERAKALADAEKERQAALEAFATGGAAGESPEVKAARDELNRLRKQAADAAAKAAEASGTEGAGLEGPGGMAGGKGSVAASFSAAALSALGGGGGVMDKLLRTNEDQKKLQQKQLETAQATTMAVVTLNTMLALTP